MTRVRDRENTYVDTYGGVSMTRVRDSENTYVDTYRGSSTTRVRDREIPLWTHTVGPQ